MKAIIKFFCTNGILAIPLMFWFNVPYLNSFITSTGIGLLSLSINYVFTLIERR